MNSKLFDVTPRSQWLANLLIESNPAFVLDIKGVVGSSTNSRAIARLVRMMVSAVGDDGDSLRGSADLLHHLVQLVSTACHQRQPCARLRREESKGTTDAVARTGDQDDAGVVWRCGHGAAA